MTVRFMGLGIGHRELRSHARETFAVPDETPITPDIQLEADQLAEGESSEAGEDNMHDDMYMPMYMPDDLRDFDVDGIEDLIEELSLRRS